MSIFQAPRPGILPAQSIETLIATGAITSDTEFDHDQVQPASLDLRLSDQAWRVRASFLPGKRKVEETDRRRGHARHRDHRPPASCWKRAASISCACRSG